MLVMMEFERLARHDRRQRIVGIRQIRQREGHRTAPWEVRGELGTPTDVRSLRDDNLAAPRRRGNSVRNDTPPGSFHGGTIVAQIRRTRLRSSDGLTQAYGAARRVRLDLRFA